MARVGGTFCGITEDLEVINDISVHTMKQEGNTETESCVLCAQYNASWLNGSTHYRTLCVSTLSQLNVNREALIFRRSDSANGCQIDTMMVAVNKIKPH